MPANLDINSVEMQDFGSPSCCGVPGEERGQRYFRAVNYLAAAQIYLQDNVLLERPLQPEHIKPRLLGHWGTCPGINLLYQHLNGLICRRDADLLLVTGPGHGAAANLANMYLDGSLAEYFPELTRDRSGLEAFVRRFSRPGGFPSHLSPALPGVIHEGGELGYALATAFGAVLDRPKLIAVCLVGDGEAETGPTATAWHGIKFLDPVHDGAVIPVLHLNGFKTSNPSIFATMSDEELLSLFRGYGYEVRVIDTLDYIHEQLATDLNWAHDSIVAIQNAARRGERLVRPAWPLLILRTPKGWTGPKEVDGHEVEGSFRSHQIPCAEARTNPRHLAALEAWLRSYHPGEILDSHGRIHVELTSLCPQGDWRISMNPASRTPPLPLKLPDLGRFEVRDVASPASAGQPSDAWGMNVSGSASQPEFPPPARHARCTSGAERLGEYLRDVVRLNEGLRGFRIVCPDELESNRLGAVLDVTARQFGWPIPDRAEKTATTGRVLEMLSEHMCQGWLQGYLLTGRHGVFPCYEAFLPIVDGMMNQYAKFLKTSQETPWRHPVPSLNYFLTSTVWRQEHNGFSHQGPGFLNNLLTKKGSTFRIYLPPDANTLLCTMDHCLRSTNYINLVIAGKHVAPQWLSMEEAREHCRIGASIWRWASSNDGEDPQVVLAGCGDSVHVEIMAAAELARQLAPGWRIRVVNVADLQVLGVPNKYPHGLDEPRFERIFPRRVPVVFNFHGYTAAIKQLVWERPDAARFEVNGYREEGTTTTPFDMLVRNGLSRFHVLSQAARRIATHHPNESAKAEEVIRACERSLEEHGRFILREGIDPPEIDQWNWRG